MKIAITGATGHIGACLVRELLEAGHTVSALVYRNTTPLDGLRVEKIRGDLLDSDALANLVKGSEVVIHAAAKVGIGRDKHVGLWETNVKGTELVIDACRAAGVRRLLFFSSVQAHQHAPVDSPLDESRALAKEHGLLYDRTKATAQELVLAANGVAANGVAANGVAANGVAANGVAANGVAANGVAANGVAANGVTANGITANGPAANGTGLETIVLNPSGVIGPYDYGSSLMGNVLVQLFNSELPALSKGGFDFVDVRDVSAAVVAALNDGRPGESYLLGCRFFSIIELGEIIERAVGIRCPKFAAPYWLSYLGLPFIRLWARITGQRPLYNREYLHVIRNGNAHVSSDKAKRDLAYTNRPLEETIADAYHWYVKLGRVTSKS